MLNLLIFIILLIIILAIKEFELKKESNDEFNPFIFNFTLNNDIVKYPSIFDTTESYILFQDEDEVLNKTIEECLINIKGKNFSYFITKENLINKGYIGLIGLSNINRIN